MKKVNLRRFVVKLSAVGVVLTMVGMLIIVVLAINFALPALLGTRTNPQTQANGGNVPKVSEKLFNQVIQILESKQPALEIIDQNRVDQGKQNLGKDDPFAP